MGQVPVRIDVAGAFADLARDLRRAAAGELRRELYKGLQRAARPTLNAVKANASILPSSGGRGRRRTRTVTTGTLTNAVSGQTHKVKELRRIGGALTAGESVADRVAGAKYTVRSVGGRDPRIRLQATESKGKRVDLESLNRGRLRHPLFGRRVTRVGGRSLWFDQAVPSGWFTGPIENNADRFAKELDAAIDRVAREIDGS